MTLAAAAIGRRARRTRDAERKVARLERADLQRQIDDLRARIGRRGRG